MPAKSKLQFPNNKQYLVTIPKSLVEAKGWKKGDTIEFYFDAKGKLVLDRGDKR